MKFQKKQAIENAQSIFKEKYSQAEFGIASGSIVFGIGRELSDLDLVIIYKKIDRAYRECFFYKEMPIECFVHDYETIQGFLDNDYKSAFPSTIIMLANGIIIPEPCENSKSLVAYSKNLLEKGPQNLEVEQLYSLRYIISDLIDDLQGNRTPEENLTILYTLYPKFSELVLRQSGNYFCSGKHLANSLKKYCPNFYIEMGKIMKLAHLGQVDEHSIAVLRGFLDKNGGYLFDGYKQLAPLDRRNSVRWSKS